MSKKVRRLFTNFQPNHYIVQLEPDGATMRFRGTVIVSGKKTGRPSRRLTFHQKDLTITKAHVVRHDRKGDQTIAVNRINRHTNFDEVRLHTADMLFPGNYTISMQFEGVITPLMNGMYPCYFEHDGRRKHLLATQFESHHARDVFPCIDEPEAKATFDLSLTAPIGQTVIANTPIKSQTIDNNQQFTVFETTPKMSTYLLAFVIGEIGYTESHTKDGVVVRAYATPDNVAFTEFALDVAVKCLEFYNDYFGIPYPLEKCDLVALPDFASGAMENWGCITFREAALFVDPNNTSLAAKQYVAMVVAHELAHQWFGNLVTMRWWTDLWLNEGFASWIEYLAVDHLFPEWNMWVQFISDEQQLALKLDALEHTHPIEVPIHHPDEIRTIFDTISYSKGASVIHMLHQYLGAEQFRDGMRHYLSKHAYHNTITTDLWLALEEISHKPVKNFMEAWTTQSGFPLLRVTIDNKVATISQERFFLNPESRKGMADLPQLWPVPLLSTAFVPTIHKETCIEYNIEHATAKINSGQSGFYRTIYNASNTHRLGELTRRGQLDPLDRLGILSDAFEAAKAGYIDTSDALALMKYYDQEDNAAVWDVMAGNLGSIRSVMDDDILRDTIKPYIRQLVAKQLERLGWESIPNESHFDQLLRPTILGLASIADEPDVVQESLKRFQTMQKPEDVPPDIRGIVYNTAARLGDNTTFHKLVALHNGTQLSEERTTLAAAITAFKQPELNRQALAMITTSDVRHQDIPYWVAYSFANRHAKHLTWEWMVEHWNWLEKNLGDDLSFARFPLYAARCFSDTPFLVTFKDFFMSVIHQGLERSVKQGIETIQWQADWKARDLTGIKRFFDTI